VGDVIEMAAGGIFQLAAKIGIGYALAAGFEKVGR
jgi:hypothetical protein